MTIVNRQCATKRSSGRQMTREAIAFLSATMLNIYAVKTGSEFATSSYLKIYGFARPHDSKLSTPESGLKKLRFNRPDSPDTCGRKANPKRKSCGYILIRIDGALDSLLQKNGNLPCIMTRKDLIYF